MIARQCSMRVWAGCSKGIMRQACNRGAYLEEMHTVGRKILENIKRMQNGAAPKILEGHGFHPSCCAGC